MVNLYLFRNVVTDQVLVSPFHRIQRESLRPLRFQQNFNLRPDLWLPFAVVSGICDLRTSRKLATNISHGDGIPAYGHGSKVRSPRSPATWNHSIIAAKGEWKIPDSISTATGHLCRVLNSHSLIKKQINALAQKSADAGAAESEPDFPLTIHWERMDYRSSIEQAWPEYVQHKKLELKNGRFPVVPEFSHKTLKDTYHHLLLEEKGSDDPAMKLSNKAIKRKRMENKLRRSVKGWKSFDIKGMIDPKKLEAYYKNTAI